MTPRQRVRAVLEGELPDRVPVVVGVSNATGIKMGAWRRVKELAGIDEPDRYLYDWPELGTALPGESGLSRLHTDVRGVHDRFPVALLRKNLELSKTLMGHVLEELGPNVDLIKIGDDPGSQEGLFMSPGMYRELLAPIHAELIGFIRERTRAAVFFHTDGDVCDLVPDFIEMGVDVLNPIQTSAGRMSDLERLKAEYGGAITFCGAIDTHDVLAMVDAAVRYGGYDR
ncbi:MAG: uroporphyrinogen decarboxylase family protein [Spirochaetota bacterium]